MAGLTEREFLDEFRRTKQAKVKGPRTKYLIPYSHGQSVQPGTELIVEVPKLLKQYSIVPGTLNLVYDIVVSGDKSYFKNNLSKLLQQKLRISAGGYPVYENTHESVYRVYEDLWKSKTERDNLIEFGIANLNLRKLISGEDSGASSGDTSKDSDALMYKIYGTRQKMSLNNILMDHGLYPSGHILNELTFAAWTPPASDVIVTQTGQTQGTYELSKVRIEYEVIDDMDLAKKAAQRYQDTSWGYDHIIRDTAVTIPGNQTDVTLQINKPRKMGKAIVILFTEETASSDSEKYVYPDIEKVAITHASETSVIYRSGMDKNYFYEEAKRFFHGGENRLDPNMNVRDFYKDKFALVIDMRSVAERYLISNGKPIEGTQSGIKIEINKSGSFATTVVAHPFLVSDGIANFSEMVIETVKH